MILHSKLNFLFLSQLYMKFALKIENTTYTLLLRCHKHVISKVYK